MIPSMEQSRERLSKKTVILFLIALVLTASAAFGAGYYWRGNVAKAPIIIQGGRFP